MQPIKLLAISSSPKEKGQTAKLLQIFIEKAEKLGTQVKRINLYNYKLEPVDGILGKGVVEKSQLQQELIDCDGFVIATPTYWFNVPGILKNFIDSLTALEEENWKLEGKVAGFIVYSPEGGETTALANLALTFNHMGIGLPPYSLIFYRGEQDKWALGDIELLAGSLVQQINAQREKGFHW